MWHLFKHQSGGYDFAFIDRSYIGGSNQGYTRAYTALKSLFKIGGGRTITDVILFQDDTGEKAVVKNLYKATDGKFHTSETGLKARKKYVPNLN